MSNNILSLVKEILKKDERLTSGNTLLKNKIIELTYKQDEKLIELLLSEDKLKEYFFTEVNSTLIFNKDKFVKFVNNKEFLPDSYTTFKNKIGITENREYFKSKKEVCLSWPYKDCVLEGDQADPDEDREEIFWNEILAPDEVDRLINPKVLANFKRINKDVEDTNPDIKSNDNLLIKGNNLLVLHSIKKKFRNKIKMIYIDPPYNTGGDNDPFSYNNNFNHSTWLTFMKNRLNIAKEFLKDDGFIAITIDHNELFYLGTLADEIFGRKNRVGVVSIVNNPMGRQYAKFFSNTIEFMIVYAKNINKASFNDVVIDEEKKKEFDKEDEKGNYQLKPFLHDHKKGQKENNPKNWYPIYVSNDLEDISLEKKENYAKLLPISDKGRKRSWMTIKNTTKKRIKNDNLVAKRDEKDNINLYYKFREQQRIPTHWDDKKYNANHHGSRVLQKLVENKNVSYPKSLYAVIDTLKLTTSNNDIIMDFFAGSGTTGHATLKLNKEDNGNRKFILIEQLGKHINNCYERMKKILSKENIDDSFTYCELMKWNKKYIDQIKKANSKENLVDIWNKIKEESFLSYKVDPNEIDENIDEFKELSFENKKKFLFKCLDKNHLYVNLSEIDDEEYEISQKDKELNKQFYEGDLNV